MCVCECEYIVSGVYVDELTRRGVTSAVMCSVPNCNQPISDDSELYCIQHDPCTNTQRVSRLHYESHTLAAFYNGLVLHVRNALLERTFTSFCERCTYILSGVNF